MEAPTASVVNKLRKSTTIGSTGPGAVALTCFARGVERGGWAVEKSIYPGQGRLMCDGSWGRCEADAHWVSALRCALCSSCSHQMNNLPSGKSRRVPWQVGSFAGASCHGTPHMRSKTKPRKMRSSQRARRCRNFRA